MAADPVSSATEHAAEVIEPFIEDLYYGDPCVIAAALAAAGLLCTPQERAVIDAAIAETDAEDSPITQRELDPFREARRVAVAEHNQHRNPK